MIYRKNKTEIDTSEYASNVPIDIISTNFFKSNNNAISAIKTNIKFNDSN